MSKLIGTNPNQVPSNADLGTAAFIDKKEFLLSKGSEMSAINAVIPKTAIDVFVYDTTKDSDGGAWRKRTQDTSWYNERLMTTTRGSRKEFPVVAVIVAESDRVTIYDGDDPTMPMWMMFNQGGGWSSSANLIMPTTPNPVAISVLNGVLSIAYSNGYGVCILSFISEEQDTIFANNVTYYNGNISQRNNGLGHISNASDTRRIVNSAVNDVDMTVLPNAPIDADTGLPVPTIAVATDGGVSVIKDDGTVIDYTGSAPYDIATLVNFTKDGRIRIALESGSGRYYRTYYLGSSDRSVNQWDHTQDDGLTLYVNYANGDAVMLGNPIVDATEKAVCTSKGVTFFEENLTTANESLVAHATSSYNTGWMHGDIKLATLSDTDTTNAVGVEILTNTNFTSGTSPWVAVQATISAGSNKLTITPNSGVNGGVYHAITTVPGKTYVYQLKVLADASNFARMFAGTSNDITSANKSDLASKFSLGNGTHSITFVATGTTTYIWIEVGGGTQQATEFDDATVRLAEEDRSVNNNGLQVFGTVTKTAVATGAELVGYNASNTTSYLEQPYNSDLDFGTAGDFHYSFWVYSDSSATYSGATYIFERTSVGDPSNRRIEARLATSSNLQVYATNATFVTGSTAITVNTDSWNKVDIVRKSNVGSVWINGLQKVSGSHSGNMTDTSAKLTVCNRGYFSPHNQGFPSGIALFRVSATAPSAEQIAKIYNDEKHLFQENAKATLYGSSDAVTALAYDDDTELLHVGTSAGRSDFQGLRRINNTTRAIGTAISAVDGFIVEE